MIRLATLLLAVQFDGTATTPSSFVDLRPGDELIVRHHSYGCFHVAVYDLAFRRDTTLSVSVVLVRSGPAGVREPRYLATLAVTDSAAADLDELVRLHREALPRRSNGGLRIELTQKHHGAVMAKEHLENHPVFPRLGSYGFTALIEGARRAAPATAFSSEFR